jgi:hypothetical protein
MCSGPFLGQFIEEVFRRHAAHLTSMSYRMRDIRSEMSQTSPGDRATASLAAGTRRARSPEVGSSASFSQRLPSRARPGAGVRLWQRAAVGDPFPRRLNLVNIAPQVSCFHQSVDGDVLHGCGDGRKISVLKITQELTDRAAAGPGSVVHPATTPLRYHGATVAGSPITTAAMDCEERCANAHAILVLQRIAMSQVRGVQADHVQGHPSGARHRATPGVTQ